jgi:hypothetical protein
MPTDLERVIRAHIADLRRSAVVMSKYVQLDASTQEILKAANELEAALAQQTDDKLADTQRAIIESAEARGYRRGIEEAQQPGAQAVVIPEPSEDDVEAAQDAFDDVYDGMPGSDRPSLRAALTTYTARLRERLGQAPGGDGDA